MHKNEILKTRLYRYHQICFILDKRMYGYAEFSVEGNDVVKAFTAGFSNETLYAICYGDTELKDANKVFMFLNDDDYKWLQLIMQVRSSNWNLPDAKSCAVERHISVREFFGLFTQVPVAA